MNESILPLRETLAALQAVLVEFQEGNRSALFDAHDRLRRLNETVSAGPHAEVAAPCSVALKVLGLLLRQGPIKEDQAIEITSELLHYVDEVLSSAWEARSMGSTGIHKASCSASGDINLSHDEVDESRLGEILVQQGRISSVDLNRALSVQQICRRRLGDVLVAIGIIDEAGLREALEYQRLLTLEMASRLAGHPDGLELRIAKTPRDWPDAG